MRLTDLKAMSKTEINIKKIKRLLKELKQDRNDRFMIQLSNQIVLVGDQFEIMKKWKSAYRDKEIVDMFLINRNRNQLPDGVTSLEKIIAISDDGYFPESL